MVMTEISNHAKASALLPDFNGLKARLRPILENQARFTSDHAPEFALLRWLRLERNEAAHSAIIKNLLDPQSSHAQGTLFIESFLRYCRRLDGFAMEFTGRLSKRRIYVDAEVGNALGRPDIRIVSRQPDFAIIIENKIDQHDQTSQLSRYSRILHSEYSWAGKNVALMYLTPGGSKARDPSASSIHYTRISYREDVSKWLDACAPRVEPVSVRAFVTEYVRLVEKLTKEPLTEEDEEP
jgi:hypothetical protein